MKNKIFLAALLIASLQLIPFSSAAHFIVGVVQDALDGTSANGKTIVLWNPANGLSDNLTDIIGPIGNSGANNIYLFDCELLSNGCSINDEMRVQVFNEGDNYLTNYTSLSVTGAGFDLMGNLTLNSPPTISQSIIDDEFTIQPGEIDLTPASTTTAICEGVAFDYDGENSITGISAELFDTTQSFYGDLNANNHHYSNASCSLNTTYGNQNEVYFACSFQIQYYANTGSWNCTAKVEDNFATSTLKTNSTFVNPLLAISIDSPVDFGEIGAAQVSPEITIDISNVGNTMINLTLSGYGEVEGDGDAMSCSQGQNIPIEYKKYDLVNSHPGEIDLSTFENLYSNLTSTPKTKKFNLNYRQNDLSNDAISSTFWRIYAIEGASGSCTGNIVFGATISPEN